MTKYSKAAQSKVKKVMREYKQGKLKSGTSGKKVKNRKQAIAIGLSEARKRGYKAPKATSKARKGTKSTKSKSSAAKRTAKARSRK